MAIVTTRPGPNGRARPSLGDQLDRLDGILNGLSDALNESVTAAVSVAVGKAVREAVDSATREIAARPALPAAICEPGGTTRQRRGLHLTGRPRVAARRVFAAARRVAGWLIRRLGTPLLGLLRRAVRAWRFLLASAIAGAAAGTLAGFIGPLIAAALGGLAGSAVALGANRSE